MFDSNILSMLAPLAQVTHSSQLNRFKNQRARLEAEQAINTRNMSPKYSSKFPFYSVYVHRTCQDDLEHAERLKVEFAVAGYTVEEISVELSNDGVLSVKGSPATQTNESDEWITITHGIAKRSFSSLFQLPKNAEVDNVNLRDGILSINISVHQPVVQNSKTIPINTM
jgi:HSP20 family molecular chaperone IbpA